MRLDSPIPILRMFDEDKAREFYVDFLGFRVDWGHRFEKGLPLYWQVSRGHCILHLSEHYGDATPGTALRIHVDDIDMLYAELTKKHHPFGRATVQQQPWAREIQLRDPFGNRLVFAQPSAD